MDRFAIPVGARLAGEGVLEIAFAGKPGSYRELRAQDRIAKPVGAGLLAKATGQPD
jgi:hypothetical protein